MLEVITANVVLKVVKDRAKAKGDITNGKQTNEADHDPGYVPHQVSKVVLDGAGFLLRRLHAFASGGESNQKEGNSQDAINHHGHLKSPLIIAVTEELHHGKREPLHHEQAAISEHKAVAGDAGALQRVG